MRNARTILQAALAALVLIVGCEGDGGGLGEDAGGHRDTLMSADEATTEEVYIASGDPFAPGPLAVESYEITEAEDGPPVALRIFAPTSPGRYALVQFQHGFLLANDWYQGLLLHLASHGFVVVAPQMYAADGIPLEKPTAYEEAETALAVHDWLRDVFAPGSALPIQADRFGLAGHSRGGKVVWAVLREQPALALAAAGVDPVDGEGGPLGGEERVLADGHTLAVPTLVLGTGLGPEAGEGLFAGACAPAGDNHEQFWAATGSPAWHVVATEHGHMDMLDELDDECGLICDVCLAGPDPDEMRRLTAGLLAALFRLTLQRDTTARAYLEDPTLMPAAVTLESR